MSAGPIIHWRTVWVGTVVSTMDEVSKRATAGEPEGLVVVADHQTGGRGRAGRSWVDSPGSALLVSLLLRPEESIAHLTALPLLLGVCVSEAIEALAPVLCRLKWPNDVLIDDRKVAGILCTTSVDDLGARFLVAGVGINLGSGPSMVANVATSVFESSGVSVSRQNVLRTLLSTAEDIYGQLSEDEGACWVRRWTERATLIGQMVTIVDGDRAHEGVFTGIDASGAARIDASGRTRSVVSGDLVRGPIPSPGSDAELGG